MEVNSRHSYARRKLRGGHRVVTDAFDIIVCTGTPSCDRGWGRSTHTEAYRWRMDRMGHLHGDIDKRHVWTRSVIHTLWLISGVYVPKRRGVPEYVRTRHRIMWCRQQAMEKWRWRPARYWERYIILGVRQMQKAGIRGLGDFRDPDQQWYRAEVIKIERRNGGKSELRSNRSREGTEQVRTGARGLRVEADERQ